MRKEKSADFETGLTVWLTGLPCSGKTVLAKKLGKELAKRGIKTVHLDGDVVRKGLNSDLGFSKEDRKENLRRVAHVARLFNENHCLVIASFVSPTNDLRQMIKGIIGNLFLVFVKCSPETCEKRDVKGMYAKARKQEIKEFTGVSAPFEEPAKPDIVVETDKTNAEECTSKILQALQAKRLK